MFKQLLDQTATVKRMSTATKTKRTYEIVSGVTLDVHIQPETNTLTNTVQGQFVQMYNIYTTYDANVLDKDQIIQGSDTYSVVRQSLWSHGGISYKKCVCTKD